MSDIPDAPEAPSPSDPLQGERPHMHRAFCLWLMQDDDARSLRAVARAVGRGETTVRGWRQSRHWNERALQMGPAGQTLAIRHYREKYFKRYGSRELACVERTMSVPFLEHEVVLPPHAVASGEGERTEARHALDNDDRMRQTRRHVQLLDATIGKFVQDLQKGKIKVGVREAVYVIKLRHELADVVHGTTDPVAGQVVESARVRIARSSGGDVVEAMYEDGLELVAIFGALIDRRGNQEPAGEVVNLERAKAEAG